MRDSPLRRLRWRAFLVLMVYWLILFSATHWPRPPELPPVIGSDKVAHMIGYAILSFLLARAVAAGARLTPAVGGAIFAALAAYGLVDELLQPLVGRSAEVGDWVADLAGGLLGLLSYGLLAAVRGHWRNRSTDSQPPKPHD